MLRAIKLGVLHSLKAAGIFDVVADSRWRQNRLLILCYHGTSLEDEHLWRPALYVEPRLLEQRLETLKREHYAVLPLEDGLQRLWSGSLPRRAVCITFDDGTYDFYKHAYPLLKRYQFPATVYQTTYYMDFERPIFTLICSYMLWKRRGVVITDGTDLGLHFPLDLRTEAGRHKVVRGLLDLAEREDWTGQQKDEMAARLACFLKLDYDAVREKKILRIMNRAQVEEVAANGVDVQLHTHRHRTPVDEHLFRREIQDNRRELESVRVRNPVHFCYPAGVYREQFYHWLASEQVVSATTCDAGLASAASEPMLIPRYIDNQWRTAIDFESWLSGIGDLLAFRRAATQKYVPVET